MANNKLTQDEIVSIKDGYGDGVQVKELAAIYEVSENAIRYHIDSRIKERNKIRKMTDAALGTKKCPRCRKVMDNSVNFCSNCGENLKSRSQIAAEELEAAVLCIIQFVPENSKDYVMNAMRTASKLLKEAK